MAKSVTDVQRRQRDLEAFVRYFTLTEGPRLPSDLPLLEYCAGSLGMARIDLAHLLGYHVEVGVLEIPGGS